MRGLARLRFLLTRWRRSSTHERALDAELQAYLQADIDARVRAGDTPAEARRQALIDLGGVEQVKEVVRERRTGAWVDGVVQDLRYAVRTLRKSPSFTVSVLGSMSLGLGAMIAGFAFANAILLRPTPGIRDPQRLIDLTVEHNSGRYWEPWTSADDYRILAEGFREVAAVAASHRATVGATLPAARSLEAKFISDNYFGVLGARLILGAPIGATDNTRDVVLLAHHLWVREFGGDPDVLGRTIRVGDYPMQIAGVVSADFGGPSAGLGRFGPDLWLPLRLVDRVANIHPRWAMLPADGELGVDFVARLIEGRQLSEAHALAPIVASRIAAARNRPAEQQRIAAAPLGEAARRRFAPLVALVLPVPMLVLAIACVNVVNLLLARASVREREMAVRLSIGASRGRIVRQLLIESVLLSAVSAALALPLVVTGLHLAENGLRMSMPVDGAVIGLALLTVVATAVVCGLEPALQLTRRAPARSLSHSHAHDITPKQSRTRRALVVAQVALSLGLLAVGSQLLASIRSTERGAGTDPDQLLMASFDVRQVNMPPDEAERFYSVLLQRVSARRETAAAGIASPRAIWTFGKGKQEDNSLTARYPPYGPRDGGVYIGGYAGGHLFDALGLRMVSGRAFTPEDRQGNRPRVAIVNQAFVDDELHGAALGRTLNVGPYEKFGGTFGAPMPVQIVGVVESASERSYTRNARGTVPAVYIPIALLPEPVLTLYAKSATSADVLMPIVRDLVHEIDPRVAVTDIGSLADVNAQAMAPYIAMARAGTVLGVIALLLAAWGLYAVMSHVVAMRSREFAIRMALGAEARAVLRMVARQAARLAGIGITVGLVAAVVIGQIIQAEMHGTRSAGLAAVLTSAAILGTAMLVASVLPAIRASRANPITLLKDS